MSYIPVLPTPHTHTRYYAKTGGEATVLEDITQRGLILFLQPVSQKKARLHIPQCTRSKRGSTDMVLWKSVRYNSHVSMSILILVVLKSVCVRACETNKLVYCHMKLHFESFTGTTCPVNQAIRRADGSYGGLTLSLRKAPHSRPFTLHIYRFRTVDVLGRRLDTTRSLFLTRSQSQHLHHGHEGGNKPPTMSDIPSPAGPGRCKAVKLDL